MSSRRFVQPVAALVFVLSCCLHGPALAEEEALTRARVAELVRFGPAARAIRAQAGVARAAIEAADTWSLDNPVVSGMAGVRFNEDGTRPFAGTATLTWPVDVFGQRGTRVEAASAEHRAANASAEEAERRALLNALVQHALVLRDERAVAIATERLAISARLVAAAQRRRTAGSVAQVDVALASLQHGRDAAALASAEGTRDADREALRAMLGLTGADGPPRVAGELVPPEEPPPLSALVASVDRRADVRSAVAALEAARSRAERERAARFPTISVVAQYERDDGANIGTLGLAVPLPVLNANRSAVATSTAEIAAASARLQAVRAAALADVRELEIRYIATKRALEALRPTVAAAAEAVLLATRGYELGENDLASVLLVRREAVDAELALLEAEQAHANAKLELLVAAGRSPR